MKAGIPISISVALSMWVIGCANNDDLYGKWSGDRDWKQIQSTNELAARALAAVDLTVKGDGTFILHDGGMPFEGNWTRSGNQINLMIKTFMGKPLEMEMQSVQDAAKYEAELVDQKIRVRPITAKDWVTLTKTSKN